MTTPGNHSILEVEQVSKSFGDFQAVNNVSIVFKKGEFFSLLGPSGCGKTTLLRMIAGLETPTTGKILMESRDITNLPSYERETNMVFQQYALFPHLTVIDNIRFGLRYLPSQSTGEQEEKIEKTLKLVQLTGLEKRKPNELSGGQRQRVALARALVLEPKVLLLDEPMGALDQKLRKEMQVELKNLQRNLGITFILVTHDQEEALTMSDRIAVMNQGKIEQLDNATNVFEKPRTAFVANFMDASNIFEGIVKSFSNNLAAIECHSNLSVTIRSDRSLKEGEQVRFVVRPEKMKLCLSPTVNEAYTQVTIEDHLYKGAFRVWIVRDSTNRNYSLYQQNHSSELNLKPQSKAYISWDPRDCVLLAE